MCVHSCCSVCSTNEVDGNVMYYYLYMRMLQKYQFEHRDYSHISCYKDVGISLAKNYKSFKFTVATSR
jgi:predicted adenine nucleotide alpha hydrolase (AANH) superfamily ATPase